MEGRLAARKDIDQTVDTLIAGFVDDPVFSWMYPDPAERPAQLRDWFGAVAGFAFNHGHCYLIDDDAAAIWVPPDVPMLSDSERQAIIGMVAGQVGEDRAMTIARGFGAAGAHHPDDPPSMMLWYVAVRPGRQGAGIGQQVLSPVLHMLDRDGYASYLHSTNGRNVPFYQRLGWDVLAEVPMPGNGPIIRPMWREPWGG